MNVQLPIYLDYAATTPIDDNVMQKMCECMPFKGVFGNPHSQTHQFGWQAAKLVAQAREQVATLINARAEQIIWTSGATEANNLAIKGVALANQAKGKHIITSQVEHKAVLGPCAYLEKQGFKITYLPPEPDGTINPLKLKKAISNDTILISIMHINNEVGAINDITKIGKISQEKNIILHVDAAQSCGRLPIDVKKLPVNLMSFSGHKIYGPKGIGALYIQNPKFKLVPLIHGGDQERGIRSGTLATHQIVGMGEACAIAALKMQTDNLHNAKLRNQLWDGIKNIEAVRLNGSLENGAKHILNVTFEFIEGESLLLGMKDIAVATGSACTSATLEPSYVLRAMGLPDTLAHGSIRFSFGRFTSTADISYTIESLKQNIQKLRDMSPLWDMYKQGIDINRIKWREH